MPRDPHLNSVSPVPKTLRDDIQGLRALAVLAVVAFHANCAWLAGGFVGVDVFFVISGYLITSIILRQRERANFSFVAFYLARLRSIVPAYIVMINLTSIVMAAILVPRDFEAFNESAISALYFGSNVFFARCLIPRFDGVFYTLVYLKQCGPEICSVPQCNPPKPWAISYIFDPL
ncbi:acyltransferase [Ruegeria conchae]|uniref:acyltransferase family protein n=1 Tax=Ruegeria conchae TaxID=981384 RepID=UPI00147F073C|nr:acyltransferase [Ruegeria conchae]UWR02860.1 acyltransferase [Ruegeria conchae]